MVTTSPFRSCCCLVTMPPFLVWLLQSDSTSEGVTHRTSSVVHSLRA